ncbi:hypothetical protein [Halorubrum sp. SD626R]|uniref:hypothetical protein n=1 Tax=Halorubrum sp. SD626R TaxID=1419722 RepID=UPI000A9A8EC9|nr:hypothetical protein [Halorubrum sp. SD626R]TKX81336.1 hypothetical protein EXE53_06435 [Halorubrum sp. SD626R]
MAVREGLTHLTDLTGSGDNVLVKALVTHIQDLDSHKPYQKGLLRDRSMSDDEVRPFVVYDADLRLDKGKVYVLNGTDYEYAPSGEIQVVLGEDAYSEEIADTSE